MQTLVWFRSDLRVDDNAALSAAASATVARGGGVVGLYVLSPEEWRLHDTAAVRVEFILRTLRILSDDLAHLNIALRIEHAAAGKDVPGVVHRVASEWECDTVHYNAEYELDETRRDDLVRDTLTNVGIRVVAHHDQCVFEPGVVRTKQNGPYTVFTPFKRAWLERLSERGGVALHPRPARQPTMLGEPSAVPDRVEGFTSSVPERLWPAGEHEAQRRLRAFVDERINDYKADRDIPAIDGTSTLSPYLAVGAISARQCLREAIEANNGRVDSGRVGAVSWVSELIWREFYRHILVAFPRVCMRRAFKTETDRLQWRHDEADFARWREGRTGVPIVDAAMRQLRATGWMHNRLRMIAAMYLTKDLFIDWRWGERWFMQHLIDGDLANNNGGWQWSASTGTDAAPYFRIFNPVSQSRRYDPDGEFIRAYCPELRGLDNDAIHDPASLPGLLRARLDYPEPMVDRAAARERVLAAFKALSSSVAEA